MCRELQMVNLGNVEKTKLPRKHELQSPSTITRAFCAILLLTVSLTVGNSLGGTLLWTLSPTFGRNIKNYNEINLWSVVAQP